jgi:class 3 adenylate cyclase
VLSGLESGSHMVGLGEVLESFLPLEMLHRLHGPRGDRPAAVQFSAAVIFVDVSRYTNLVEQLTRRGQEGLQRIPSLLNRSYARCVEEVCDRGGEIVYLVGDAILAYWPADDGGLGSAVQAAADCAEAICSDHTGRLDGTAGEIEPALHVGVGAGELWAAAVGGQPVWNLVAGGDAVLQAANCQALADRWEYVLSDRAKMALAEKRDGLQPYRLVLADKFAGQPAFDWLVGFLPPQLRDAITGGDELQPSVDQRRAGSIQIVSSSLAATRLDALAEIRPVTVILARITGLDHSTPQAVTQYHALCMALQDDLNSHGGPPGELHFDDKGTVFTAVFGARGSFHRDDAYRAVDTACAISLTARRLGLTASIGVTTGEALFHVAGSLRRRQFMVLGAPMNRAARLMTTAQEGVLCDAPTERASRNRFSFEQCGTLQLDGLGDMAAVFRPMEPRAETFAPATLIGRQSELAFLTRTYDETRGGGKRLVVVLGASGIGKTALVNAFAEQLRSAAAEVCVVQAEREDRRRSLLPWRRVLAYFLGLSFDSDGSVVLDRIADRVGDDPRIVRRLPLLEGVLGVEIDQNDQTRHLDGAHRADATMRLLGDLIGVLAPQPCVCIFEDSQWLDSASWRIVEWVIASRSSIFLVLCVRVEEIPQELKNLQWRSAAAQANASGMDADDPARFCRFLNLEELNEASIGEVVTRTLENIAPQPELASRLAMLAGGNPLFAEEIALTLKTKGLISIRDGLWGAIRPIDNLRYFEAVERVVRERLDRLEATALDVLRAASVIGRSFTAVTLKTLLEDNVQEDAVDKALETLVAAHFTRRGIGSRDFEFRHDQIRDVVYSSVPLDVRQRLHGSLAEHMESSQSADTAPDIAVLVQHFEAAGNKDKLVNYADRAATDALQIGAYREAVAFLDICLGQESRSRTWNSAEILLAVRWRRQLAEAHYGRGDLRAQALSVRRGLTLVGYPVPRTQGEVFVRLFTVGLRLAFQQLFTRSQQLTKLEGAFVWEQEIARCLSLAAVVDYFELRFSHGFCNLVAAVMHAERTGVSVEMAVASAQLACGLGILGKPRACGYFMARAERTAIALADPAAHAYVCNLDALWRIGHCDWPSVVRRLDQCQELCLEAGDQLRWCNAQALRFWVLYYRGDRGVALEHTAQGLLSRAQNSGNIQQEIWGLRHKALCVLDADHPLEAVEILQFIAESMQESADLGENVCTQGMLSLAHARMGRNDKSVRAAVEALHLLQRISRPTGHVTLVGISGVCEVLLRGREAGLSREYDRWGEWERQALYELRRYRRVFPVGGPQYGLWTGVSHWLNGRNSIATYTWENALAAARRLSLRQDEAMIVAEMRRRT